MNSNLVIKILTPQIFFVNQIAMLVWMGDENTEKMINMFVNVWAGPEWNRIVQKYRTVFDWLNRQTCNKRIHFGV